MKVMYLPQAEWGVGHLVSLEDGGARAWVSFPARESQGAVLVSTRGNALVHHRLAPGARVRTVKGLPGTVTGEEEGARGLRRYVVALDEGRTVELPETELLALPPRPDLVAMLKEGRVADARSFVLRHTALGLDDERKNDALGALLASRVMVKPHQVGVVQRVLSSKRPRFILADEVGLGKTIEAGMVFSALRLSGLARRVLVVAPSHLTVQWLVELFHKFNQLFTLMDPERYQQALEENPTVSPWARFEHVITSLELLQRSEQHRAEVATAGWDLVIIDEAHHLKGPRAFEAARGLAASTWGLLLLTATPMQLDVEEYRSLLTLIDPLTAPTTAELEGRLARQEELAVAVRGLLGGEDPRHVAARLAATFPADGALASHRTREGLLSHLAETYSLSERLIRNRRATVGGFSPRRLHVHPVQLGAEELAARAAVLERLGADGSLKGAALATVVKRVESSPAAFAAAVRANKALAGVAVPPGDGKFAAFLEALRAVWALEPRAKILVFTEARDTLDALQARLRHHQLEALAYHGELDMTERDRQVARFRDPEGPLVLLSTEVGGEGRNFQFAHHLFNYDLPWSPATMEQRIGRLDRIGQLHPVDIHVFDVAGTFSAAVLEVLKDAVGVFDETVGGLDAVVEEVEERLTSLVVAPAAERRRYLDELEARVAQAREQVKRAYDPLLDIRSFDRDAIAAVVERAHRRFNLELDPQGTVEDGLWSIARDLDERLEECVTELADRIGVRVDTDQDVDAFQTAFHFGHALNVEALPGFDITRERTVLGTFWRDTAVEQEEIEYFATGHPFVEALFGFLRDGPFGRNGARYLELSRVPRARGVEVLFHVTPPEPADTSPGARVPSRQLSRFFPSTLVHVAVVRAPDGTPVADEKLPALLAGTPGRSLKGPELAAAFPELPGFVEDAVAAASRAAHARLEELKARARALITEERDQTARRLRLALTHHGVAAGRIEAVVAEELDHTAALLTALEATTASLDSAAAFIINR